MRVKMENPRQLNSTNNHSVANCSEERAKDEKGHTGLILGGGITHRPAHSWEWEWKMNS